MTSEPEGAEIVNVENAYIAASKLLHDWGVDVAECDVDWMYTRFFEPSWESHITSRSQSMALGQAVGFMRDYVAAITEQL